MVLRITLCLVDHFGGELQRYVYTGPPTRCVTAAEVFEDLKYQEVRAQVDVEVIEP